MKSCFPIFVVDDTIKEDEVEYSAVVDWCYSNIPHPNIIKLIEEDVYLLQYKTSILDIINTEIDGMLQVGEDDWVIDHQHKLNLKKKLELYLPIIHNKRASEICSQLIVLLNKSISESKNIYFHF